jgi:hypothetical protein
MTKKSERKEAWMRIIVAMVSGIVLEVWGSFIGILILLNWIITVFSGKRNKELALFSEYWNTETYKFMKYITFVTNERPFPFTSMQRIGKFQ